MSELKVPKTKVSELKPKCDLRLKSDLKLKYFVLEKGLITLHICSVVVVNAVALGLAPEVTTGDSVPLTADVGDVADVGDIL
jgi:hypothetical protein